MMSFMSERRKRVKKVDVGMEYQWTPVPWTNQSWLRFRTDTKIFPDLCMKFWFWFKSRLVCASEACIRFVLNSVSVGSVVKTRRKPEKYRRTQIRPIREICFLSHSNLFSCKCGQSSCLETKEPFKGEKFIYFLEAKLALNLTVYPGVTQPSSGAVCPKVL